MEPIKEIVEYIVIVVETIGIIVIVAGLLFSFIRYVFTRQGYSLKSFEILRQEMGKAILLGLEILVAGDIIETVCIEPTLNRIASLSLIVIIRTILSLSIGYEISGKIPWKKDADKKPGEEDN